MRKIEIKIPDNLTQQEEVVAISKKLMQRSLTGSGASKEIKRIGTEVNIIDLHTQINIIRESKEPVIEMVKCNVCGCDYQNNTASFYWHNYGGNPKRVAVCSEKCVNAVVEYLGDRAATSKYKLKRLKFF